MTRNPGILGISLFFRIKKMWGPCERERLDILRQILLENYKYMVNEFYIKKRSQVAGETTFNTTFRVNITDQDDIQIFISKLGEKLDTDITEIVEIFMVPVKTLLREVIVSANIL